LFGTISASTNSKDNNNRGSLHLEKSSKKEAVTMSNIIDLEGGQEEEATAMAAFEPTPTMCLHSRMQILEEKEWRQWITHVMEEDQ
jgi:hypothetical protein